jgi:hypothetical protein
MPRRSGVAAKAGLILPANDLRLVKQASLPQAKDAAPKRLSREGGPDPACSLRTLCRKSHAPDRSLAETDAVDGLSKNVPAFDDPARACGLPRVGSWPEISDSSMF